MKKYIDIFPKLRGLVQLDEMREELAVAHNGSIDAVW